MWSPDPNKIQTFRATGTANMGDVQDMADPFRFGLRERFALVYIKGLFVGGDGFADLTVRLQHRDRSGWSKDHDTIADSDGAYDFHEEVFPSIGVGTGATPHLDFRVPSDEYPRYTYMVGDMLVPTWTNPDSGNMIWALEFAFAPTEESGNAANG